MRSRSARRVLLMMRVLTAWRWSLTVIARSSAMVLALAALAALWYLAAYEWLGFPESSLWLLILAFVWAVIQLLAAVVIIGRTIAGAAETAAADAGKLPISVLWLKHRHSLPYTFVVSLGSFACVLLFGRAFGWINDQAINIASYLTFRAGIPISHLIVERIFLLIERLLWIALAGFVFSSLIILIRAGWAAMRKQLWKVLAGCLYRAPFLTSLVTTTVFGGVAYLLTVWHPRVPAGFWDYVQAATRCSLALFLCVSGELFWVLSIARLYSPQCDSPTP